MNKYFQRLNILLLCGFLRRPRPMGTTHNIPFHNRHITPPSNMAKARERFGCTQPPRLQKRSRLIGESMDHGASNGSFDTMKNYVTLACHLGRLIVLIKRRHVHSYWNFLMSFDLLNQTVKIIRYYDIVKNYVKQFVSTSETIIYSNCKK